MARIAQIRKIFPLPGKLADTIEMLKEVEPIRQRYGLVEQVIAKKRVAGSDVLTVILVWEDEDALKRWLDSDDRHSMRVQARHLRVDQPSALYDVF